MHKALGSIPNPSAPPNTQRNNKFHCVIFIHVLIISAPRTLPSPHHFLFPNSLPRILSLAPHSLILHVILTHPCCPHFPGPPEAAADLTLSRGPERAPLLRKLSISISETKDITSSQMPVHPMNCLAPSAHIVRSSLLKLRAGFTKNTQDSLSFKRHVRTAGATRWGPSGDAFPKASVSTALCGTAGTEGWRSYMCVRIGPNGWARLSERIWKKNPRRLS